MIKIKNFEIRIGVRKIFEAVLFNVQVNDQLVISGPNGSGKSLFLKALAGQLTLAKAQIEYSFDKKDPYSQISLVSFLDESKSFGDRKNQFYQQRFHAAFSDGHPTVKDYLLHHYPGSDVLADDFIKVFKLEELWNRELLKLSSGQTRKVILAKAILKKPKLLLLDNPYVGLDKNARTKFNDFIDQLVNDLKLSLIICDHETVLPECINRYYFIDNGILAEGIYRDKNTHELKNISLVEKQIVSLFQKKKWDISSEVFIEMNNVGIKYNNQSIVSHVNWIVKRGERWWLKGLNGSGKSTLISMIYADIPQGYGQRLKLFGSPQGDGRTTWDIKKYIGFSSSELHFYVDGQLSSEELIFSGINDQFVVVKPDLDAKMLSDLLFTYFSIEQLKDTLFHNLSTGEQRKVLFIRALIKRPLLLLLDEPFQAFDNHSILKAKSLLDLIVHQNMAMIFVSHRDEEVPNEITNHFIL